MSDLKSKTKQSKLFHFGNVYTGLLRFMLGIIKDMVQTVKPASGWKILIVDNESMRIISAACRMFDIMEEGVTCKLVAICTNAINYVQWWRKSTIEEKPFLQWMLSISLAQHLPLSTSS